MTITKEEYRVYSSYTSGFRGGSDHKKSVLNYSTKEELLKRRNENTDQITDRCLFPDFTEMR